MNPIDAVISWVDGYDPVYQEKLKAYCAERGIEKNIAVEPTRIQQCNEIYYCLQSLGHFAPWLRTIYIITNQQIPAAVNALQGTDVAKKIKIIDQNDLLAEFNISNPIFNSLSIEWLIWHIKGLSQQFLYLNDDFFIVRAVKPEDFFKNNQLVLHGEWKTQSKHQWQYKMKKHFLKWLGRVEPSVKTNPHRAWQENAARLAGWDKFFYLLPHAPFSLNKKTFDDYLAQQPECFIKNTSYPFRHEEQVSSIPLMVHLDIKNNRIHYDNQTKSIMVNGATHSFKKIQSRLKQVQKDHQVSFLCMQSIDQAPKETQQFMIDWLQKNIHF